jgi:hypothetical protein
MGLPRLLIRVEGAEEVVLGIATACGPYIAQVSWDGVRSLPNDDFPHPIGSTTSRRRRTRSASASFVHRVDTFGVPHVDHEISAGVVGSSS